MATGAGGVCRERFLDSVGEDMVALSSCERQRAQWRGRHISTGPQITGRHGLDRQPGLPHRVTGPMNRVHGLAPDRSKQHASVVRGFDLLSKSGIPNRIRSDSHSSR
jgi:hypothetical protein